MKKSIDSYGEKKGDENMDRKINKIIHEEKFKDYVKKPVVVQAYQTEDEIEIETLEGVMKANKKDYIIKGIEGEIYPCKPDIFKKTYETLNESPNTIDKLFNQWEIYINELSDKEKELLNVKKSYSQLEQNIIENTDFKALYGKNNEKIKTAHVESELQDLVVKKQDLELRKKYLKRKIIYLQELIRMQRSLLDYSEVP